MTYCVPFGMTELCFDLKWSQVDIAESRHHPPPLALAHIDTRLRAFAENIPIYQPITIVFTDATRASPDQILLEPIVDVLHKRGAQIRLLCAVGMHRPSTEAEKVAKLGARLVEQFEVIDHDPRQVVQVGVVDGVPIEVNRLLLETTVLSVGVVEPHQYAGYSGGYKTTVIGCGGPMTIARTHGPEFLNKRGTCLGNVDDNPFQAVVRQGGRLINHALAVNVVLATDGAILHLEMGTPHDVHDMLIAHARQLYECCVPNAPYDVVIAGVGAPKDVNFYQASRAATYIGLSAKPIIRSGGVIILPAPLPEQGGQGVGEQHTLDALRRYGPTQALIDHLLQVGCRPGEQRAFMIAQLHQRYRLIVVGAESLNFLNGLRIETAPDMWVAQEMTALEQPRVLIVPHALQTLPIA